MSIRVIAFELLHYLVRYDAGCSYKKEIIQMEYADEIIFVHKVM